MATGQELSQEISLSDRKGYFLHQVDRIAEQFVGTASDTAAAIDTTANSIITYANPNTTPDVRQAAKDRYQRATSYMGSELSQKITGLYVDVMDDEE